ncbi:RNA-directed DNA polymerase (reverse transcriptase)-related family protein [Quillaja saponaria]|uniref:RNA-directed DNA polymerase (Reverse transcriptase)-related family protein n=1 Tax=Quillaja saponaria TaxID=32244 RepID=A0AAD7LC40_QUISA|nr:RNA-directed DNA polymerase (reverse transcriptase)-related family protein [Quillaja saponaria]KAJ7955386.1 RNA-directed DNA polymerase (reverse transcriptase)-related family protein [Quillaja saponaria]
MEMEDQIETTPSLDVHSLRSRIEELADLQKTLEADTPELTSSDLEKLLTDCALELESTVQNIVAECSEVEFSGLEDVGAYLEYLNEELNEVEVESTNISNEIEVLSKTHKEDLLLLESNLEELKCSLDFIVSKELTTGKTCESIDYAMSVENHQGLTIANKDKNFELLKLDNQIDDKKTTLKSLQDLHRAVKWFDAIEQIEDALTGLKVLAFDDNCIRLSLLTCIPKLESLSYQEKVETAEPAELNHELLIEVLDGTMELKNVEIFPNDVYMNDIVDAAKSLSLASLRWFITKVQDRIVICSLRRLVVKDANKSRHSFEYLDKDETVVAHMAGGIDAFIKVSPSWPILSSPLKLISLKSSDYSKGISSNFIGKVEVANSLDAHIRQNISSFMSAIEKILAKQMH